MKIHAVYDRNGKILAAVSIDATSKLKIGGALRPVPKAEQHAADLEVPPEHSRLGLVELCRALKVEGTAGAAKLVPK
jgi:hypothetical protein